MTYVAIGSAETDIDDATLETLVCDALTKCGDIRKALVVPPDGTRPHSRAGSILRMLYEAIGPNIGAVLPALGTHQPMSGAEISRVFPGVPPSLFLGHDWRRDCVELGRIDADFVERVSGGEARFDWPVQANRLLVDGSCDLVVSVGQVVPHEVVGMANHAKNLFVGLGGKEAIDKSHYLGALYGCERIMGMTDTPVRALFDEALTRFGERLPRVLWMQTVVGRRPDGTLALRGFYAGDDRECFERAAALSRLVNMDVVERPIDKAVVWLDPAEYRSAWLGNKSIYRLRMAMAEGGELLVIGPGVERFGEDARIDALIRKYGYRPAAEIRRLVDSSPELGESLSAAAHLIHGSTDGKFRVTWAPGPALSARDVEAVGYRWGDAATLASRYDPAKLRCGRNELPDGEEIFFVPDPALGLWIDPARYALRN